MSQLPAEVRLVGHSLLHPRIFLFSSLFPFCLELWLAHKHSRRSTPPGISLRRIRMSIDMNKLNSFMGQFVGDLGAAVHTGMVVIGEKLGLYKTLAPQPMTSAELAAKTNTDERYVREWLASQAAGGYVSYDDKTRRYQRE
jgi:hypothetical protein